MVLIRLNVFGTKSAKKMIRYFCCNGAVTSEEYVFNIHLYGERVMFSMKFFYFCHFGIVSLSHF